MRNFCLLATIGSLLLTAALPAQTVHSLPPAATSETFNRLILSDAPMESVLQLLEAWSGRTVLRPEGLPDVRLNIRSTRPLTTSEGINAIVSLLELNGVGVFLSGEMQIKLVDLGKARHPRPDILEGSALDQPASNRIVTKYFELRHLSASAMAEQLARLQAVLPDKIFLPGPGDQRNYFTVYDTVANLQRIELLVKQFDQPPAAKP